MSLKTMIREKTTKALYRQYAQIVFGCVLGALAYPLLLEPNYIAPGGLTGIATVLKYLFKLPIGLSSLLLNIPLFLAGWKQLGKGFVFRTLFATILFSLLIDLFRLQPLSLDPLLGSVFGGVMLGAGMGLIMRGSATTGGTDLLARLVRNRFPVISVGAFLFALDFLVVLMAGFLIGTEHAMYAMICVYIASKVLDSVLVGLGTDKACYIISDEADQISQRLMAELERGVTRIGAVGEYSKTKVQMLLCIVNRLQTLKLKEIVRSEDPDAFVFITDTHETLGEGFKRLTGEEN